MTSQAHSVDLGGFVEGYLPDDDALLAARVRADELGCPSVGPACGSTLRFLAAAVRARAVVEIGTGVGVSGLYLMRGMTSDGVLTSIDIEPEFHRAARRTFADAGYPPGRTRLIMGRALDVLPRLTAGNYDLVFVDASPLEYPHYREHGVGLLRPGGVIVFHNMLVDGRVIDPARRDADTMAMREVARALREDDRLVPALLPVGGGLLAASVT
ncbi:O-methyltransferase [Amycolatopsis suaedae]|uniref:O-methyltransferase n=1 Tax=Amycolatopsis suaedae TaxID=2510978 RepID=A0A4Q7J6B4_9PSEU|nr:O-methyltransferase [Amycolatopsis suaedae]RZQ62677.1 O-methyltransferase [Amycolatopsis suaedae]